MKKYFSILAVLSLSAVADASSIKLVNSVSPSTSPSAEFQVSQGSQTIAKSKVNAGESTSIPTTANYQVQALTQMGDFVLTSNTLTFNQSSATVVAQMSTDDGSYDFQIVQMAGIQPNAIALENTWRSPVQFKLSQPGNPTQINSVVDVRSSNLVSTSQSWTAYAIANGITTPTVTFSDPDTVLTLTANDNSFSLVATGPQSSAAPSLGNAASSIGCILNQTALLLTFNIRRSPALSEAVEIAAGQNQCFAFVGATDEYPVGLTGPSGFCQDMKMRAGQWMTVSMDNKGQVSCKTGSDLLQ